MARGQVKSKPSRKLSQSHLTGWETRRRNAQEAFERRSRASIKGHATKRANARKAQEAFERRSRASIKGHATKRAAAVKEQERLRKRRVRAKERRDERRRQEFGKTLTRLAQTMTTHLARHHSPGTTDEYDEFREAKRELYALIPNQAQSIVRWSVVRSEWSSPLPDSIVDIDASWSDIDTQYWEDVLDDYDEYIGDFEWFSQLS